MTKAASPAGDDARQFALNVARRLTTAGHQSLLAGGCVRDELLGVAPKDYDVATSATPAEIRAVFGRRRTIAIGAAFGVITVLGEPKREGQVEVATFRTDGVYSDGRRPDSVAYSTAEQDARRRDFTINGLFRDPHTGEVIDYVGGRDDLRAGVIRAIGDPAARIAEDKLRMLRAVRFAARLGFRVEHATSAAIRANAAAVRGVSAERIGAELRRMLLHDSAPRAARMLAEHGLLRVVAPALARDGDPHLEAFERRFSLLNPRTLPTVFACLLPPAIDPAEAYAAAGGLRFTRKHAERLRWLLENRHGLRGADTRRWSGVQPLLAHEGGQELVSLHEADAGGPDGASRFCRAKLMLPADRLDPAPLLTGGDLIALGFRPGPGFSQMLSHARAAQLDGRVTTKREAIARLLPEGHPGLGDR